jgi:cell division septation protein DedD
MMMAGTKTRTQRRMERKQAVTLLVLVLVVSLSSFTLGVMVGRRGAERDLAQRQAEPKRIMVAEAPRLAPATVAATPAKSPPAEEEELTFYDNLARDEAAPLGSGINLPPEAEPPAAASSRDPAEPVAATAPAKAAGGAGNAAESAAESAAEKTPVVAPELSEDVPSAVADGGYSVQVGSFASVADAGRYKKTLQQKGYPVFIAEADLGAKGIWYRVRLGPYADADAAQKVLRKAAETDHIKGFVSRL